MLRLALVPVSKAGGDLLIPRQIISCWFGPGGPEEHDKFAHCIASWKKVHPDWPILFFRSLKDFGLDDCAYARAVTARAKQDPREWVKLTELCRLAALRTFGGVYLDCDVELLKPLDPLLGHEFFIGREDESIINGAVIGSEPGSRVITRLLERFPKDSNGDQLAVSYGPRFLTDALNSEPALTPTILPPRCFYPIYWTNKDEAPIIREDTYAVHWWAGSWC